MTPRTASLAVVGGANVDLVVRCAHLPRPGETVLGEDVVRLPGGKGANQACAAARLGVSTTFVGCLGNDESAEWLMGSLHDHGVDTSLVQRSDRASGTAMIAVDNGGENIIVVASGANRDLRVDAVDIEAFDVVLAQLETPIEVVDQLSRRARQFVLNAAPRIEVDIDLLARCSLVIVNEGEAEGLDLAEIPRCVITLGARGARYFEAGIERTSVRAPEVVPVDTVGAGDVFVAAMTSRFAAGDTPEEALRFAVTAGALATLAPGAQGALPSESEVRTWLARAS